MSSCKGKGRAPPPAAMPGGCGRPDPLRRSAVTCRTGRDGITRDSCPSGPPQDHRGARDRRQPACGQAGAVTPPLRAVGRGTPPRADGSAGPRRPSNPATVPISLIPRSRAPRPGAVSPRRWCGRPDSNRHGQGPRDFKSPMSTIPSRPPPVVPAAGLEPARLAAGDFESPASTIPPRGPAWPGGA